ncbi:DNA primase small subunit [Nymphon striatum]|nr:DNA primase small subunit [Nymphon striatum]
MLQIVTIILLDCRWRHCYTANAPKFVDKNMDEKFEPSILTNLLGVYYQRLFPYDSYYRWLSYGNVSKNCFSHREFSFTLADDIYMRYRSFSSQSELEVDLQKYLPHKIDIGAVYNYRPKDRRSISTFQPLERELVFDIDITDYDDVRNCCDGAKICKKCWPLMTIAIKILDRALTEDFGFQDLLWVYSGRRGVHCWVCDEKARKLSASARSAIAEYLSAVKGGAFQSKKVNLGEADLHASFQKAVEIIGEHFTSLQLENQGIMDNQLNYRKILR